MFVATTKFALIIKSSMMNDISLPPTAEYLRNYFKMLAMALFEGYQALERHESRMSKEAIMFTGLPPSKTFDTMDGIIIRDHIKAALAFTKVLQTGRTQTASPKIGKGAPQVPAPKKSPRPSKVAAVTRSKANATKKISTARQANTARKSQRASSPKRSSPPRVIRSSKKALPVANNVAVATTRGTRSMTKKV
ncbi:hypothetical protein PHLCEN_2v7992 [Hermanssonia centrifuga]|uniref:Uncharacterized protein n=1 Tax=Hermanssonia centrifuga TaxID=98765 RepID=A0A2R6NUX7_9APHY|nr:hypothetical protein PHLCEN_2v7992 [Hermanssonia centrifuga]